jgi:hypothetical protein
MRWRGRERSRNVEDIRAQGPARGRGGLAIGGGLGLVIAIVVLLMGGDPGAILQGDGSGGTQTPEAPFRPTAEEQELVEFISVVLKDTEDVWHEQFRLLGKRYEEPKLVLFRGSVEAGGCGLAGAGVGPFYCPATKKLYIDLAFYGTLRDRLGAPGDFAQAYVIAHEVGHHVQNLLGQSDELHRARGNVSEKEYNRLSVRLELQADFHAGLWAHHAERSKQILERGDIEEALNAASKIGDDALQRKSQGRVVPDSFTHGSSAQRMAWFRHGLTTGDIRRGNTFDDLIYDAVNPR